MVLHGAPRVPAKHAATVGEVLQALGAAAYVTPERAGEHLAQLGFVHADTRAFLPPWGAQLELREKIGLRLPYSTVEKLLDPARTGNLITGIAHGPYLAKIAGGMRRFNVRQGLIVQGLEGSCDLSPQHPTRIADVWPDANPDSPAREIAIDPAQLGLSPALNVREIGADPQRSAELTRRAFENKTDEESRGAGESIALNAEQ